MGLKAFEAGARVSGARANTEQSPAARLFFSTCFRGHPFLWVDRPLTLPWGRWVPTVSSRAGTGRSAHRAG